MSGFEAATGQRALSAYGLALPADERPAVARLRAVKPWGVFDPDGLRQVLLASTGTTPAA